MKTKITRELAEAAGYYMVNRDSSISDVAHDWKVDEAELSDLIDRLDADGGYRESAEEAIANWIEDNAEAI